MRRITGKIKNILLSCAVQLIAITVAVSNITMLVSANPDYNYQVNRTSVLMYHLVQEDVPSQNGYLYVRPGDLENQIAALSENGYKYIFADEIGSVDGKCAVMTFDDGYEDNYTELFPILKETGSVATIFVATDLIGRKGFLTQDEIREMYNSGLVRFGSHTASHTNLSVLDDTHVRDEMLKSKYTLESITGGKVDTISYPGGLYNGTVINAASQIFSFAFTSDNALSGDVIEKADECDFSNYMIPRVTVIRECRGQRLLSLLESPEEK